MARYLKGSPVANATSYELYEKITPPVKVTESPNLFNKDIVNQYYKGGCFLASNATWYTNASFKSTNLIPIDRPCELYMYGFKSAAEMHLSWYSESATEGTPTAGQVSAGNISPQGGFTIKDGTNVGSGSVTFTYTTDANGTECFKFTIKDTYQPNAKYIRLGFTGSNLDDIHICQGARYTYEQPETTYNRVATNSTIHFDVTALGLGVGEHTLVVKAKADGYLDSDYSNEVMYTVDEEIPVYSITTNFTNCGWDYEDGDTIAHGTPLYAIFSTIAGYKDANITVTMSGVDITADVYADNEIDIPAVTGDIVVTATATEKWTYTVTLDGDGAYLSNTTKTVEHGDSFVSAISAYMGLQLDSVTVKMGGKDITATAYSEGNINIASVTGNIVITAMTHLVTQEKLATPEIYME